MLNFVIIGVGGYIAPKHISAIKATGNDLVAAIDKHDSVGVLDGYFPECNFFTEFERFDRHCEKIKRNGTSIDYVVICSPNYLHDAHIRFGLRIGANVICEKPLVLNPWNIAPLKELEKETGKKIFCVLQLRLHDALIRLKNSIANVSNEIVHNVDLKYITSRGNWYFNSWKGELAKSGGITTNIGIHLFDLLIWIFGPVQNMEVTKLDNKTGAGVIHFKTAKVTWLLSVDAAQLPDSARSNQLKAHRVLQIDSDIIEFNDGFENLHARSYEAIIAGRGLGVDDTVAAIELTHAIRNYNVK